MDEERKNDPPTEEATQTVSSPSPTLDPAMLARIASVLSSLQTSSPATPSPPPQSPNPPSQKTAIGDGLAGILSDPTILEKLPQIMAMLKPLLESQQSTVATSALAAPKSSVEAASTYSPVNDRNNLLLALKPFLSSGRRDAVDSILRIEKLGELFKSMQ